MGDRGLEPLTFEYQPQRDTNGQPPPTPFGSRRHALGCPSPPDGQDGAAPGRASRSQVTRCELRRWRSPRVADGLVATLQGFIFRQPNTSGSCRAVAISPDTIRGHPSATTSLAMALASSRTARGGRSEAGRSRYPCRRGWHARRRTATHAGPSTPRSPSCSRAPRCRLGCPGPPMAT